MKKKKNGILLVNDDGTWILIHQLKENLEHESNTFPKSVTPSTRFYYFNIEKIVRTQFCSTCFGKRKLHIWGSNFIWKEVNWTSALAHIFKETVHLKCHESFILLLTYLLHTDRRVSLKQLQQRKVFRLRCRIPKYKCWSRIYHEQNRFSFCCLQV